MLKAKIREICSRYLSLNQYQKAQLVDNQTSEIMSVLKKYDKEVKVEDSNDIEDIVIKKHLWELKESGETTVNNTILIIKLIDELDKIRCAVVIHKIIFGYKIIMIEREEATNLI